MVNKVSNNFYMYLKNTDWYLRYFQCKVNVIDKINSIFLILDILYIDCNNNNSSGIYNHKRILKSADIKITIEKK